MVSGTKPLKILHLITGLDAGGAEMTLFKLLSQWDRENIKHEVVSLIDVGSIGEKIKELGVPVQCVGMVTGRPGPISFFRLLKIIKTARPDLIQGWMYHGNLAAQLATAFLPRSIPVSWNIRHSIYNLSDEKRMTAWVIRLCAKISNMPAKILYCSKVIATQHETLGFNPDKSVVIHNGFDTDLFCPSQEARNLVRQELAISPSAILIGLIGRYHPMKDHSNFIRAAEILNQSHPDVHFLLVGCRVDANNMELLDQISNSGLLSKFHLLGERDDVRRLTAALDIASSSSYGEGFPNVIGEAMSCEISCAVTDVGESGWLVRDTGRVVPPRNPEALANAWRELLDMGIEKRKNLGKLARERIISDFSLNSIASQYESLYSQFN